MATQTLGEMYADKGGPDLVKKYTSTWQAWSSRMLDVSPAVRLKCLEAIPALLGNLPDSRDNLNGKVIICYPGIFLEIHDIFV